MTDRGEISRRSLLFGGGGAVVVLAAGGGAFDYEVNRHLRRRIFGCGSSPSIPTSDYTISTGTYQSAAMHGDVPWEFGIPTRYVADPGSPRSTHPSRLWWCCRVQAATHMTWSPASACLAGPLPPS